MGVGARGQAFAWGGIGAQLQGQPRAPARGWVGCERAGGEMGQELCALGGWGASCVGGGTWAQHQALKRAWVRLQGGGRWHHGLGSPEGQGGLCADTGSHQALGR